MTTEAPVIAAVVPFISPYLRANPNGVDNGIIPSIPRVDVLKAQLIVVVSIVEGGLYSFNLIAKNVIF